MTVTGHIRTRNCKNGKSYQLIVEQSGNTGDGKRNRTYKTFKGTKKQAEQELRRMIAQIETGTFIRPDDSTVYEFINEWLEDYVKPKKNITTYEGYVKIVERDIKPTIGTVCISNLTPVMVQKWINQISGCIPL